MKEPDQENLAPEYEKSNLSDNSSGYSSNLTHHYAVTGSRNKHKWDTKSPASAHPGKRSIGHTIRRSEENDENASTLSNDFSMNEGVDEVSAESDIATKSSIVSHKNDKTRREYISDFTIGQNSTSNSDKVMARGRLKRPITSYQDSMTDSIEWQSHLSTRDDGHPMQNSTDGVRGRSALQGIAVGAYTNLLKNISSSVQTDAEKGRHVKMQRDSFDSLINTRMCLQKGLIAANTVSASVDTDVIARPDESVIEAVENAALLLMSRVSSLRDQLATPYPSATANKIPLTKIFPRDLAHVYINLELRERRNVELRSAALDRWAKRTATHTNTIRDEKLRINIAKRPLSDVLSAKLDEQGLAYLVNRTRIARICAPRQSKAKEYENGSIYDDADWYALLLRELVDGKLGSSEMIGFINRPKPESDSADVGVLRRESKRRRLNIDKKASKGRKLKHVVQEKVQNFVAPDDRTTWEERQARELFGRLMGRYTSDSLNEKNQAIVDVQGDIDKHRALRLFGK